MKDVDYEAISGLVTDILKCKDAIQQEVIRLAALSEKLQRHARTLPEGFGRVLQFSQGSLRLASAVLVSCQRLKLLEAVAKSDLERHKAAAKKASREKKVPEGFVTSQPVTDLFEELGLEVLCPPDSPILTPTRFRHLRRSNATCPRREAASLPLRRGRLAARSSRPMVTP